MVGLADDSVLGCPGLGKSHSLSAVIVNLAALEFFAQTALAFSRDSQKQVAFLGDFTRMIPRCSQQSNRTNMDKRLRPRKRLPRSSEGLCGVSEADLVAISRLQYL